ncbi:MAG: hypothetical protein QM705_07945 [Ancrocorticia sp.]
MSTHDFFPDRPPHVVRRNRLIYLAAVLLAALAVGGAMVTQLTSLIAVSLAGVLGAMYWGWPHLTALPNVTVGRAVTAVIGGAALLAAAAGSAVTVAYVAAVGVLVVYIGEMVRRDGRVRLLSQVIGTYAGGVLGVSAALWLTLAQLDGGAELAFTWLAGMATAGVAGAFVRGPLVAVAVGVASFLGSAAVRLAFFDALWWPILAFAVILGILAWGLENLTRQMLAYGGASALVAFALLPFCAMGVAGYALALLVF